MFVIVDGLGRRSTPPNNSRIDDGTISSITCPESARSPVQSLALWPAPFHLNVCMVIRMKANHELKGIQSFVVFDLETTGIDTWSDVPVSYALVTRDSGIAGDPPSVSVESGLINPGVPIPGAASSIHHITDDMVARAPDLESATDAIATALSGAWTRGAAVVGMNVGFDLTMLDSVLDRLGLGTLRDRSPGLGPIYDVLVLDRTFDKYRKGSRRLTDLCRHYDVELDSNAAHDAAADCLATLGVLDRMMERYPDIGDLSPDVVMHQMSSWHQAWLTNYSKYRVSQGDEPIDPGQFVWPIHQPA